MTNCKSGKAKHAPNRSVSRTGLLFLLSLTLVVLAACYPARYSMARQATNDDAGPASPQESLSQVYFYPKAGQTTEQQSRDHYECYNWAIKQTGFDPSQSPFSSEERVRIVPVPPPGHDTATMAVVGAVLGAILSGPRHAGRGALIGAAGGAIVGSASDASRQEAARQTEEAYARHSQPPTAQEEAKALDFRRAMGACLEGRGYSVK
jgi:hypothetical protein